MEKKLYVSKHFAVFAIREGTHYTKTLRVIKVAFPSFTSIGQLENVKSLFMVDVVEVLVIGLKVEREKLLPIRQPSKS